MRFPFFKLGYAKTVVESEIASIYTMWRSKSLTTALSYDFRLAGHIKLNNVVEEMSA